MKQPWRSLVLLHFYPALSLRSLRLSIHVLCLFQVTSGYGRSWQTWHQLPLHKTAVLYTEWQKNAGILSHELLEAHQTSGGETKDHQRLTSSVMLERGSWTPPK